MILLLITFSSSSLSVFKYNKLFLILTLYLMLLLNSPFVKVLPFCRFYCIFYTHNCNVCKYMFASSFSVVVPLIFLALLHRLAHTMLNASSESRHTCVFPDLSMFNISSLSMMLLMVFL